MIKTYMYNTVKDLPICEHGDKPFVDHEHLELYSDDILKIMQQDLEIEIDNIWDSHEAFIFALMASTGDTKNREEMQRTSKTLELALVKVKMELLTREKERIETR